MLLPVLLPHQEIVTIILLHFGHLPAKRMPHLHLHCNIPHKRQVLDALWSTKQIEIKYLTQGYKHADCSKMSLKELPLQPVLK